MVRWSNCKIQILLEVVILLIRLEEVKVKTLANLVSGSPFNRILFSIFSVWIVSSSSLLWFVTI